MLLKFAQSDGTIHLEEPQSTGAPQPSVVSLAPALDQPNQLLSLLHSSLDIDEIIRLFARETGRVAGTASVRYVNEPRGLDCGRGRAARHTMTAALVVDNHELGSISFTRGTAFNARDERRIEHCLASLVLPLRNALLYHDAVQASLTDALTGVHNRKFLETTLRREIALSHRHGTPLSLLLLDIDDFKPINDEHGHQAGDDVLRRIAGALTECVRKTDVLARFGGDEFAILLSNTRLAGAIAAARHVLGRVTQTPCAVGHTILRVSPSIGVAALRKRDGHARLFERADAALYAAKHAGGGCVALASGARSRVLS
jgi:diguanylate cyclase (GGDEF)-like protein